MRSDDLPRSLTHLFAELVFGAPASGASVLNPGDAGLLASLDRLSHEAASRTTDGGASIAAHVDHLRYGLSLMNRWAGGEDPFAEADWADAWKRTRVDDAAWQALRRELRREAEQWHVALGSDRRVSGVELDGVIGSIAHVAYHLGAIRQLDRTARGPSGVLPGDTARDDTSRTGEDLASRHDHVTAERPMERAVPILPVDDLRQARAFYVDRLGFDVAFETTTDGHTGLLGLRRGAIALTLDCPMAGHGRQACVALEVESADRYHAEWSARVPVLRPPRDEPWGARTFDLVDPFGNTLFVIGPRA